VTSPKRAGAAARQLLFHRQRSEWMARKIRENEALLERLLVETGEERAYLPGGYVVSRSREGPPQVRQVIAGGGFEQLSIDDAASRL
jgi:hypothetical protein